MAQLRVQQAVLFEQVAEDEADRGRREDIGEEDDGAVLPPAADLRVEGQGDD